MLTELGPSTHRLTLPAMAWGINVIDRLGFQQLTTCFGQEGQSLHPLLLQPQHMHTMKKKGIGVVRVITCVAWPSLGFLGLCLGASCQMA